MGILDDLAMGFGLKEKTQDYYDRTEQTLRRTQGDERGDIYVRQTAGRRASAPNYSNPIGPLRPNDAPLRQPMFARSDGRDRDRSTFRNPQAGPIASFFGAGSRLGDQPMTPQRFLTNFIPGVGILRGIQRATGNQPYTMHTQSGVGPGTYQPKAPAPQQQPQYGAQAPSVQTSPLIGYGFEEDKFGFNPQTPRATLSDLDIDLNPGYSQVADGQYVPSYNPFEATTALKSFTGQPSDPRYMPGGEFDAFMEDVGSLPAFAPYRNDRKKMMEIFEQYLKTQGGGS